MYQQAVERWNNAEMHESMRRLFELAASGRKAAPVAGDSALARALNESAQTIYNWKKRGISEGGAIKAAEVFGGNPAELLGMPLQAPNRQTAGVAQNMSQFRPTLSLPTVAWEDLKMGHTPTDPFELDVIDDALAPEIFTGCVAMMDPKRPPEPAWPVLVRDKDGGVYLRDYEAGPGNTWRAVARARGFRAMDSKADGLVILAAMEGYRRPRRNT